MPNVHYFDSSGEAYDASQCYDNIHDGDVLVVKSEKVVGILVEAWPVAITPNFGEFHVPVEDWDWSSVQCFDHEAMKDDSIFAPAKYHQVDYTESYKLAHQERGKLRVP